MAQLSLLQKQDEHEKDVENVTDNECLKPLREGFLLLVIISDKATIRQSANY